MVAGLSSILKEESNSFSKVHASMIPARCRSLLSLTAGSDIQDFAVTVRVPSRIVGSTASGGGGAKVAGILRYIVKLTVPCELVHTIQHSASTVSGRIKVKAPAR